MDPRRRPACSNRLAAVVGAVLAAATPAVEAGGAPIPVLSIDYDVQSLEFSGEATMPLGADFEPVLTRIDVSGTGSGTTFANGPSADVQDGDQLFYTTPEGDSGISMDLLLEITLVDIDDTNNFAGGQSQLALTGVEFTMGDVLFIPNCIADTSQAWFGCGALLDTDATDGDSFDIGPSAEGDDYDSLAVPSLPIPLGQDADGLEGQDEISDLVLELAFSGPVEETRVSDSLTQSYEVDALLSGQINPTFGDIPINLSGEAVIVSVVPIPAPLLLMAAGCAALAGIGKRRIF